MAEDTPAGLARPRSGGLVGLLVAVGLGTTLCAVPRTVRADPGPSGCRFAVETLMRRVDAQVTLPERRNALASESRQALVYAQAGDEEGCWKLAAGLRQMAAGDGVSLSEEVPAQATVPAVVLPGTAAAPPSVAALPLAPVLTREVLFGLDRSTLDEAAYRVLREVRDLAATLPDPLVMLAGYADTSGPAPHNRSLSESRVEAVRDALRSLGVPTEQILTQYFGERRPEMRTGDGVEEAANRRVEICVVRRHAGSRP